MDYRWALHEGEIIDHNLLQGLAILAKANGHSIIDELNIAVSSHVHENLPLKLGEDGLALLLAEMREESAVKWKQADTESRRV